MFVFSSISWIYFHFIRLLRSFERCTIHLARTYSLSKLVRMRDLCVRQKEGERERIGWCISMSNGKTAALTFNVASIDNFMRTYPFECSMFILIIVSLSKNIVDFSHQIFITKAQRFLIKIKRSSPLPYETITNF